MPLQVCIASAARSPRRYNGEPMKPEFDLQSREINQNPYPLFARLRKERPIAYGRSYLGDGYMLSRYSDVLMCLEDTRRFCSDLRSLSDVKDPHDTWWMPSIMQAFRDNLVSTDDPQHKRLRNLVHKAFTPKRVEALTATIEEMVHRLLDDMANRPQVDLIADFALPLPLNIISSMMGVPEEDRAGFHRYTKRFLDGTIIGLGAALRQLPNTLMMMRFLRRLIRLRREKPSDDLITALVQAEEQGDRLSESELITMIFILLLAGHETTVNLIGSGALALIEQPDQLHRLRAPPELIDTAIEELLRFTNPVEHPGPRYVREELELHGVKLGRGQLVLPLIASANRDEQQFPDPDRLDIAREPNRHLAFGMGIHYCLGAPLARLEARIAVLELVKRFPDLRLAVPPIELEWRTSVAVRGLEALPVHPT